MCSCAGCGWHACVDVLQSVFRHGFRLSELRGTICAACDFGARCNADAAFAQGIQNLGRKGPHVQAVADTLLIMRGVSGAGPHEACLRPCARVFLPVPSVTVPPCCVTCCQRLWEACGLRRVQCRAARGLHIRRMRMRQNRRCRNRRWTSWIGRAACN